MTNKENGEKLIREAGRLFERDLKSAFGDGDFNMTIRRAQEVVELLLKGILKILGIDYPKVHDVSKIFIMRVKEKLPEIDEDILVKIEKISMWLGEARGPSFYFEKDYTAGDAQKAFEDVSFVLAEVKKISDKILMKSKNC